MAQTFVEFNSGVPHAAYCKQWQGVATRCNSNNSVMGPDIIVLAGTCSLSSQDPQSFRTQIETYCGDFEPKMRDLASKCGVTVPSSLNPKICGMLGELARKWESAARHEPSVAAESCDPKTTPAMNCWTKQSFQKRTTQEDCVADAKKTCKTQGSTTERAEYIWLAPCAQGMMQNYEITCDGKPYVKPVPKTRPALADPVGPQSCRYQSSGVGIGGPLTETASACCDYFRGIFKGGKCRISGTVLDVFWDNKPCSCTCLGSSGVNGQTPSGKK